MPRPKSVLPPDRPSTRDDGEAVTQAAAYVMLMFAATVLLVASIWYWELIPLLVALLALLYYDSGRGRKDAS